MSELRIDCGRGYECITVAGKTIDLLLCGGDRGTQDADIKSAHVMWKVLNQPTKKPAK